MEQRNSFTKEELAIAKSVDLTDVARNLGYTVVCLLRHVYLNVIDGRAYHTVSEKHFPCVVLIHVERYIFYNRAFADISE